MSQLWSALSRTGQKFMADDCMTQAAAIAFYTLFSLPALLVISVSVAGLMFDAETVQGRLNEEFGRFMGQEGAQQIAAMLRNASLSGQSTSGTLWGTLLLLIGATGVVGQLQAALNKVWQVEVDPGQNFLATLLLKRIFSVAMVVGVGFLLLVSLVIDALLASVGERLVQLLPGTMSESFVSTVHSLVSLFVIAALFAGMFRFLPDRKIALQDVLLGGLVTSVLFICGNWLLSYYVASQNLGSVYGSAGSLTVVLIWIYYSSMIMLFGAEMTSLSAISQKRVAPPEAGAKEKTSGVARP